MRNQNQSRAYAVGLTVLIAVGRPYTARSERDAGGRFVPVSGSRIGGISCVSFAARRDAGDRSDCRPTPAEHTGRLFLTDISWFIYAAFMIDVRDWAAAFAHRYCPPALA